MKSKARSFWLPLVRTAVIAGLLAWAAFYFLLERPMGSGPAGPEVPQAAFTQVWSQRPVLLLGLGDSVTAGFGARPGYSYFDRLARNPADEFSEMQGLSLSKVLPNLTAKNRSVSGSTSPQHETYARALPKMGADTFGIVVITSGGNDLIHNYGQTPPQEAAMFGASWEQAQPWIANFEDRLVRTLAIVRERFPGGCEIFLANIYDPTDGVGTAFSVGLPSWKDGLQIHAAYNAVIARVAAREKNVHLVDMHGPLLGHGIFSRFFWRRPYHASDPHYWYHENFEDPNERGYDAIRRVFLREIAAVVPKRLRSESPLTKTQISRKD